MNIFNQRGFSLAEITLCLGLFAILFTIGIFNITRTQQSTSLSTTVDTFLADFKEQQVKAMEGDTQTQGGTTADNYGIHFDGSSYTLFKGTYAANGTSNFIVKLPATVVVTTGMTLPPSLDNQVVFMKGSGAIASYNQTKSQITFKDTTMNTVIKTITINTYGVITSVVNQ
jgi:prepilin-type N-terminal cleavage/methylation domain-containing protein